MNGQLITIIVADNTLVYLGGLFYALGYGSGYLFLSLPPFTLVLAPNKLGGTQERIIIHHPSPIHLPSPTSVIVANSG